MPSWARPSDGQESGLATRRYTPCPVETLDFRGDVESAPPTGILSFNSMRFAMPGPSASSTTTVSAGSTAFRPGLEACLDHLREGDVLTVWKLDRLGCNTQHVLAVVDQLTSRGIGFRSLTEGLHTDGPMGTAMLTIMAAFAQLERDTLIERTRAGLAAAAANGRNRSGCRRHRPRCAHTGDG